VLENKKKKQIMTKEGVSNHSKKGQGSRSAHNVSLRFEEERTSNHFVDEIGDKGTGHHQREKGKKSKKRTIDRRNSERKLKNETSFEEVVWEIGVKREKK